MTSEWEFDDLKRYFGDIYTNSCSNDLLIGLDAVLNLCALVVEASFTNDTHFVAFCVKEFDSA